MFVAEGEAHAGMQGRVTQRTDEKARAAREKMGSVSGVFTMFFARKVLKKSGRGVIFGGSLILTKFRKTPIHFSRDDRYEERGGLTTNWGVVWYLPAGGIPPPVQKTDSFCCVFVGS